MKKIGLYSDNITVSLVFVFICRSVAGLISLVILSSAEWDQKSRTGEMTLMTEQTWERPAPRTATWERQSQKTPTWERPSRAPFKESENMSWTR